MCNHWISWYFFKKVKKWIQWECPRRLQNICTASRIYLSGKNQTYHLQTYHLAFQQMWKCYYNIMICTDTDNLLCSMHNSTCSDPILSGWICLFDNFTTGIVAFFLSGFSFTNIYDSRGSKGMERLSVQLLSSNFTRFADTET